MNLSLFSLRRLKGKKSLISPQLASVYFQFCVLTGPGLSLTACIKLSVHTYIGSSLIASTVLSSHILGTILHIPGGTAFYFVLNAGPGTPPSICRKKPHSSLTLHWVMLRQPIHFTGHLQNMGRTWALLRKSKKRKFIYDRVNGNFDKRTLIS